MRRPIKNSIRWYLDRFPQQENEPNYKYYQRIQLEARNDGIDYKEKSILNAAYKYRKYWSTVSESLDKNGNVTHSKRKIEFQNDIDTEGFERTQFTTYKGVPTWERFSKQSLATPELNKELINECISSLNIISTPNENKEVKQPSKLLQVNIADVHTGMETDERGTSMFGFEWNGEILIQRKSETVAQVVKLYDNHSEIHIIDYGDLVDGWDKMTTRKGHELPQNMNNVEAFKYASKFKIELIDSIQKMTGAKVVHHAIVNSNHGGDFEKVVNEHCKHVISLINDNVEYHVHSKFINHYTWNNFAFIITHGKDDIHRSKPIPCRPDSKSLELISDYIDYHKLWEYDILFKKGDSHQQVLDMDYTKKFKWIAYRAFSPSSEWVTTNFGNGTSGFTVEEYIRGEKHLKIMPYIFTQNA